MRQNVLLLDCIKGCGAFLLYRKCDAISYKVKRTTFKITALHCFRCDLEVVLFYSSVVF